MADRMERYARSGYLTAAIDCRYHGDRALPEAAGRDSGSGNPRSAYQDALVRCARKDLEHSAAQHTAGHAAAAFGQMVAARQRSFRAERGVQLVAVQATAAHKAP